MKCLTLLAKNPYAVVLVALLVLAVAGFVLSKSQGRKHATDLRKSDTKTSAIVKIGQSLEIAAALALVGVGLAMCF